MRTKPGAIRLEKRKNLVGTSPKKRKLFAFTQRISTQFRRSRGSPFFRDDSHMGGGGGGERKLFLIGKLPPERLHPVIPLLKKKTSTSLKRFRVPARDWLWTRPTDDARGKLRGGAGHKEEESRPSMPLTVTEK